MMQTTTYLIPTLKFTFVLIMDQQELTLLEMSPKMNQLSQTWNHQKQEIAVMDIFGSIFSLFHLVILLNLTQLNLLLSQIVGGQVKTLKLEQFVKTGTPL